MIAIKSGEYEMLCSILHQVATGSNTSSQQQAYYAEQLLHDIKNRGIVLVSLSDIDRVNDALAHYRGAVSETQPLTPQPSTHQEWAYNCEVVFASARERLLIDGDKVEDDKPPTIKEVQDTINDLVLRLEQIESMICP